MPAFSDSIKGKVNENPPRFATRVAVPVCPVRVNLPMPADQLSQRLFASVSADFFRPLVRPSAPVYVDGADRLIKEAGESGRLPQSDALAILREVLSQNPQIALQEDEGGGLQDVRARAGLFLSFQYPVEVSGVTTTNFLRTAVNRRREKPYSVVEFHALLKKKMEELKIDPSFSKRYLNEGFSGGEKKRTEILQLAMLEPSYAFLDETDSGLDVDSIKIVAEGINKVKQEKDTSFIIITHYNRFLEFIAPDDVSILYLGKIIAQGGVELVHIIEKEGFERIIAAEKITNE